MIFLTRSKIISKPFIRKWTYSCTATVILQSKICSHLYCASIPDDDNFSRLSIVIKDKSAIFCRSISNKVTTGKSVFTPIQLYIICLVFLFGIIFFFWSDPSFLIFFSLFFRQAFNRFRFRNYWYYDIEKQSSIGPAS